MRWRAGLMHRLLSAGARSCSRSAMARRSGQAERLYPHRADDTVTFMIHKARWGRAR